MDVKAFSFADIKFTYNFYNSQLFSDPINSSSILIRLNAVITVINVFKITQAIH